MDNQGFEDKPQQQSSQEPLPNNNDVTATSVNIGPGQAMDNDTNNCFNRTDRFHRQLTATLGGTLLTVIGGMHIGWSIWRVGFFPRQDVWVRQISPPLLTFTLVSWYISAIFGGMMGSYILQWQKKKTVYCSCATILAISSLLILIWDYQFAAVITSRLMAGLAHGILYTVLIAHSGEVAAPEYRGRALAIINLMTTLGIFLFTLTHYAHASRNEFNVERLFGILAFVISLISLITSSLLTLESPVYLLRVENEHKARENMMKLRSESVESESMLNDFAEMQKLVNEDTVQDCNIFSEGNVVPVLLMCCVRLIAFLVNNWALNNVQIRLAISILRPLQRRAIPPILTSVRFVMSIFPTFFNDLLPRKLMLVSSMGLTTIALLVSGSLILVNTSSSIYVLLAFIITHQVTVYGIEPVQHILLSEAFPLNKKRWAITFVTTFEYALQLSVIVAFTDVRTSDELLYGVTFATAGLILALGAILHFTLPETAGLSLRQARDAYRGVE